MRFTHYHRFRNWLKHHKLTIWAKENKKISIPLGIGIFLILSFGIFAIFLKSDDNIERTSLDTSSEVEEVDERIPSPLTGTLVDAKLAQRPVTAVIIENSPDARPQSGLKDAGLVFESIAEGGITRFVVLYQEGKPKNIGPVRSIRPYFNDWILTFDAPIAHVGGSAAGLAEVQSLGIKDLDQFFNADTYWRVSDRYAPHNVYTDTASLDALIKQKGYNKESKFEPWPRVDESALETPKAKNITIDISSYLYQVDYKYSKKTNSYNRTMAGQPHIDRESGKQLSPKVVVVMNVPNSIAADGRYSYDLTGSGTVTVFQNGDVIKGKWKKSTRSSQFEFVDNNGNPIEFVRGQTWVSAISPGEKVTFKP